MLAFSVQEQRASRDQDRTPPVRCAGRRPGSIPRTRTRGIAAGGDAVRNVPCT